MATYISCAETAKLVRKALKEHFKGIKFSVRSSTYSGGASISVDWIDGPATPAVEKVAKQFSGATFDGMIDLKEYHTSELNGEEVRFGADFVFCHREKSRTFLEAIVPQFCKHYGIDPSRIQIKDSSDGKTAYVVFHSDYWDETRLNEAIYNTDAKDMHRVYEAQEEAEARRHAEWEAGAPERARKQEQAERERQQKEQQARDDRKVAMRMVLSSRAASLLYLGVSLNANTAEITKAFREKVKASADGHGGYTVDMDFLVKVKEKALG